jgi:hypothetical protein
VTPISTFYKHASLQLCSAENWRFAAKHFIKKHPEDVVVHCELNSNGKKNSTFNPKNLSNI